MVTPHAPITLQLERVRDHVGRVYTPRECVAGSAAAARAQCPVTSAVAARIVLLEVV